MKFSILTKYRFFESFFPNNELISEKIICYKKWFLINQFSEFNTTTNTSETINKWFTVLCGTGFLPFKSACIKPHSFKTKYLQDYETKVRNDNLNARRIKTLHREDVLLRLIHKLHDLTFMEPSDPNTNVNYAFQLEAKS